MYKLKAIPISIQLTLFLSSQPSDKQKNKSHNTPQENECEDLAHSVFHKAS